jgi:adenine phosphoribosyltransferase
MNTQQASRTAVETKNMDDLRKLIREVPDFPKPGILFYDLTTLLKDKKGFHELVDRLCDHYEGRAIDVVVGIEARGFILAPALAYRLGAGFVPVRKPKKLPAKATQVTYALEYGTDSLEIHEDAISPGQTVLISDDLLATGGTAAATVQLIQKLGGVVVGSAFAVELTFLNGRARLPGLDVFSLIQYES